MTTSEYTDDTWNNGGRDGNCLNMLLLILCGGVWAFPKLLMTAETVKTKGLTIEAQSGHTKLHTLSSFGPD